MPPTLQNTAIVMRCRPDGTLIDVLYDELGLAPATQLDSHLAPFDRRKGKRFLEAADGNKAVLDCKLNVATAGSKVPLFFSAATSGATLVIIATRDRFETGHSLPDLAADTASNARSVTVALRKMEALQRANTRSTHAVSQRHRTAGRQVGTSQVLRLVAHDLANPISGVLAASQFLQEDVGHLLDVHQAALLRSIESSSEFALQFIESVLELHSIPSSKFNLQLQPTDMARVASECVDHLRRRAENRRIAVELQTIGAPPALPLDRRRITQAISALVRNEVECLEPGSTVKVTVAAQDDGVEIAIHSRPPQPASGTLRSIREEVRGSPSKKTLNQIRTDLSLSAVSRIVKAHRGRIRDEEQPTGSSTFRITLPVSPQTRKVRSRSRTAGHG